MVYLSVRTLSCPLPVSHERWIPLRDLIPRYARRPLLLMLLYNCGVYWLTQLMTAGAVHYDLTLGLDRAVPFVPSFIIIYILAYVQWVAGYIVIVRDSPERCFRVISGEMLTKTACLICFLFLPTVMTRPEVTGTDFFSRVTGLIYALDAPDNLFPSIHCVESWICFRGILGAKTAGRGYKLFMLLFSLLVFASTVLVKQHVLVDVISGVALAELGQWLARRFQTGRILQRLGAGRGRTVS